MAIIDSSLILYVLKASARDRLIISLLILFVIALSLSFFIGASVVGESNAAILTFIAGSSRFIGIIGLVLFTCFYLRRAFETHDVEYLLTRPISRTSFVLSHISAIALVSILITLIISITISLIYAQSVNGYGLLQWAISISCEFIIVSCAAFFFSMTLSSAVSSTLATFGTYVFARMSGQILNIIDNKTAGHVSDIMESAVELSSMIVPRFDLFSQSSWLVFGPDTTVTLPFILIYTTSALCLITAATLYDLLKKEF